MATRENSLKRTAQIVWLIAFAGVSTVASAQLNRDALVESSACGIQQALLKSPGDYVIAIVEHPGAFDCSSGLSCKEQLKIVKVLASRTFSGKRYVDPTIFVEASQEAQVMPQGFRSFIVAAPIAHSPNYYLPIRHGPVDKQDERIDEAAVKLALGPPVGPLCKKTLPADFRLQRAKKEKAAANDTNN